MRRSLIHFWRINLAVLLGAAVATAVLTGALLVGDSVRGSLRRLDEGFLSVSRRSYFREPRLFLSRFAQVTGAASERMLAAKKVFSAFEDSAEKNISRLKILSPKKTLERGYAVAKLADGKVLKSSSQVKEGSSVNVVLHKGRIDCEVTLTSPE